MRLTDLLDMAKERTGSDPKTADVIGVAKARISEIRSGKGSLTNDAADRLATLVGVPWHIAVAAAEAHRRRNQGDAEGAARWERASTVQTWIAGVILGLSALSPFDANAGVSSAVNNMQVIDRNIHYDVLE